MSLSRPVPQRVGQLDASSLDAELYELLRKQLLDSFSDVGRVFRDKYESELLLLLKLALFKLTIWDHSTTYGGKLQNLKFVNSRTGKPPSTVQKVLYGLLVVGGSYFWDKFNSYITNLSSSYNTSDQDRVSALQSISDKLNSLATTVGLANFIAFLYTGRYSTSVLRLLRLDLSPTSRVLSREPNLEFQNRQLVWNALTEFLIFILPLINVVKLKNTIVRYLKPPADSASITGDLAFLPEKTCAICYQSATTGSAHTDITNPYQGECGHIYCYVCITTKLSEDDAGFNCLRCGVLIKKVVPFSSVLATAVVKSDTLGASSSFEKIEKEEYQSDTDEDSSTSDRGADSMSFIVADDYE